MDVRAFVDESFRRDRSGAGVYLFAAVTVAAEHEDEIRVRLEHALPGRLERFHWRKDREEVRNRALDVMRSVEIVGLTVFQRGVPEAAAERARHHALWNLVQCMRDANVHDLVFEARERSQNNKDMRTLHSISRSKVSSERFRYAFNRPLDEPLLWLPDYLAGVCGEALRAGGTDAYLRSLPDALTEQSEIPTRP